MEALKIASLGKLENLYCPSEAWSCTSNDGRVISQRLTAPKTAGGTLMRTAGHGCDGVNRMSSAAETGLTGTPWALGFNYTAGVTPGQFGNLTLTWDVPAPL